MSVADFTDALDVVLTAVDAQDWSAARIALLKANIQLAKLPVETQDNGKMVRYREQLDKINDMITAAADTTSKATDNRRLITTRVGRG